MSGLPPLLQPAPPLQCGRWLGDGRCGKEAKWHVIWTSDAENGLCCDDHMQEVRQRWVFYAVHPYRMECSMPGAVFVHRDNCCIVDEDHLGLPTLNEKKSVLADA